MGFGDKWRSWVKTCISTTSFAVIINGGPPSFFKATRGLRQGDPLSPLLFIIVMEVLNKILEKAKELQLLRGVPVGSNGNLIEISHFFFANDTLIFCQPEMRSMMFLRCILLCFQAVLGLCINMHKSELILLGASNSNNSLVQVFGGKKSNLPISYLGVPLGKA